MFWLALFLFGSAIALWRHSRNHCDEVIQFLGLSLALICLMGGLVAAPVFLKFAVFAGLLLYPTCTGRDRTLKPDCPRFCILRSQCRSD